MISLTCFNNLAKLIAKKVKKYIIETHIEIMDTYFIENICHQFPDLYNQILGEF